MGSNGRVAGVSKAAFQPVRLLGLARASCVRLLPFAAALAGGAALGFAFALVFAVLGAAAAVLRIVAAGLAVLAGLAVFFCFAAARLARLSSRVQSIGVLSNFGAL